MLIGEYRGALDDKKRLSVPTRLRSSLGKKVIVTRGLDSCLFVYPIKAWADITKKLGSLSLGAVDGRGFNRFLLAGAAEAEIDSAGRILVPDFLRTFGGLNKSIVWTGVGERAEIWDESRWDAYQKGLNKDADAMAEKLATIGAL